MATNQFVDPWVVQPDQSVGQALSSALVSGWSDGQVTLARPPAACARRTATQAISDATWTAVSFTAADEWDTDGIHDASGAPTKFVIPAGFGGIWAVSGSIDLDSGTAGWAVILSVYVNGVHVQRFDRKGSAAVPTISLSGATDILVAAGDEVEFWVHQSSGGSKNVTAARATVRLVSWA